MAAIIITIRPSQKAESGKRAWLEHMLLLKCNSTLNDEKYCRMLLLCLSEHLLYKDSGVRINGSSREKQTCEHFVRNSLFYHLSLIFALFVSLPVM